MPSFCFNTFGVRRAIDALDQENWPGFGKIRTSSGSRALGLTNDVLHKKKAFKNILNIHTKEV